MNCKICCSDKAKFLGIRGNLEYFGAPKLTDNQKHETADIFRCSRCGFIYANHVVSHSGREEDYYSSAEGYVSSIAENPLGIFYKTLDLIEKFTSHTGKLLDIGSGKGEFLAAARERGWEVSGVEPSANFAIYSKEKFGIDVINSSLRDKIFPDNFFDVVTLNMVLEHIDDPKGLFLIIKKVLKEGGLLYIEVPNMDSGLLKMISLYYRLNAKNWSPFLSPYHPPYHCYGYQKTSLDYLCGISGFEIKKMFIREIGLRGFRFKERADKLSKYAVMLLARLMGWIGQGDILIALAVKNSK